MPSETASSRVTPGRESYLFASHAAHVSDSSPLLPLRREMETRDASSSIFPFTMMEFGEDADLMKVLARLRDKFDVYRPPWGIRVSEHKFHSSAQQSTAPILVNVR